MTVSELPSGKTIQPLELPHFPDRCHAVIWRNWGLVPVARLADVLHTATENVSRAAEKMGLPGNPEVSPRWLKYGYQTIIRNNWHILSYKQLLKLLDWSPEHLALILKEEDFLWQKLGAGKPDVPEVCFQPLSPEQELAAQKIRKTVAHYFPNYTTEYLEEPFCFEKHFSLKPLNVEQEQFEFNFIHPYSAGCGDVFLSDLEQTIPDSLLEQYAAMGVKGIWLHAVLYLLVPVPGAEQFSENWEMRRKSLKALVDRCLKYGLKLYLYLNEPRAMPLAFYDLKPHWAGKDVPALETKMICTTRSEEPLQYLEQAMYELWSDISGLGGAFCITMSENPTNCHYRFLSSECPYCSQTTPEKLIAEILHAMERGMHRAAPEAKMIVYDWEWRQVPEDRLNVEKEVAFVSRVLPLLPENIYLATVSENALDIDICNTQFRLSDYSVSLIGPSEKSKAIWREADKLGIPVTAKIQANNSWELSSVPYIPVPYLIWEHLENLKKAGVRGLMLSWTLGGYPGGNLELINSSPEECAARKFHPALAEKVCRAWKCFSDAFREYPFSQSLLYTGPANYGPKNLLFLQPSGRNVTMIGFPWDGINAWKGPYSKEILREQFRLMTEKWSCGLKLLEEVRSSVAAQELSDFQDILTVSQAAYCHLKSAYLQICFICLRDSDPDKEKMTAVLDEEIILAQKLAEICRRDSRIGFEASNHYFYSLNDLLEKVISCCFIKENISGEK
ncbi:MAG: hypothetical protein E7044_08560 [Lentisphaerae bacterium]|nr:hypothetical protein [Lentisphaerota bacterium]